MIMRRLEYDDESFDAVLLLGPLYRLASREERREAIAEATRVIRSGGLVFAAAIPRLVAFGAMSLEVDTPEPYPDSWIDLLTDGSPRPDQRFPAGHYHSAEELHAEIEAVAGLEVLEVHGVEGPAGLFLEVAEEVSEQVITAALTLARAASSTPGVRDLSNHLLAVARKR